MTPAKTQILIIDDQPLFRLGLALALWREPDLEVLGETGGRDDAFELARARAIDVAVVATGSGVTDTLELCAIQPACKILCLSAGAEPTSIADVLLAGASGFALKTQPGDDLVDAVRIVAGGGRYLPPGIAPDAIDRELVATTASPPQQLTAREREVFQLVIRGHTNDEIAIRLTIGRRTVETHRDHITKKLSSRSLAEMLRFAARHAGTS